MLLDSIQYVGQLGLATLRGSGLRNIAKRLLAKQIEFSIYTLAGHFFWQIHKHRRDIVHLENKQEAIYRWLIYFLNKLHT